MLLTDLVKALDMYKRCAHVQAELRKETSQLKLIYHSAAEMPVVQRLINDKLVSPHAIKLFRAAAAQATQYACVPHEDDGEGGVTYKVTRVWAQAASAAAQESMEGAGAGAAGAAAGTADDTVDGEADGAEADDVDDADAHTVDGAADGASADDAGFVDGAFDGIEEAARLASSLESASVCERLFLDKGNRRLADLNLLSESPVTCRLTTFAKCSCQFNISHGYAAHLCLSHDRRPCRAHTL